jgi:beta-lactamase superfamily II metal-dependent hydrolase
MNFYSFYGLFSLIFVGLSFGMQKPPAHQGMQVKIFNVGQGSCAVVTYPGQPSLLVDAGSSQVPAEGKDQAIAQIANHINTHSQQGLCVILSHPNTDHYNWLPDILARVSNQIPRNLTYGGQTSGYKNFTQILKYIYQIHDSSTLSQTASHLPTYCSILHPGIIDSKNDNDQSIIVNVEDNNFRVILPGDAGEKTLHHMRFPPQNKKTYFVASHHGASNDGASSYAALQALNPAAVIISSGMHAGHQHPTSIALANFTRTTFANHPHHGLLAQSPKNLLGDSSSPVIANYTNTFSLYRTSHPVYTTNNASSITITQEGIVAQNFISTDTPDNVLHATYRNYFPLFNFNTIKHLFLAAMNIEDAHLKQLTVLPVALTYFDLQHNTISATGFARLVNLLQSHSQRLVIKTHGNIPTEVSDLKPLLHSNSGSQMPQTINLCWNTLMGRRLAPQDQPCQLQTIVSTHHSNIMPEPTNKWTLSLEQLQQLLITARNNNAQVYSTQLFTREHEFFIHHPDRTTWHSYVNNFAPVEIHHGGAAIHAAWRKNSDFFLSDGMNTYIFEFQGTHLGYKNYVFGSPHITQSRLDQSTGMHHTPTCPGNGTGEQELDNLDSFRFGLLQTVSQDGTGLLTVQNGNTLLIHKKNNGIFTTIASRSLPNLKSASFCDADQSIIVEFHDGKKELLPLIMETL